MINKSIIAKSGCTSNEWLPLWMHLKDTSGVMDKLLDDFVSGSFAGSCGLTDTELQKTALFLAYVHDIGKATIGFQYKISLNVPDRIREIEHDRIIIDGTINSYFSHALAGEAILRFFGCPPSVSAVVGAHHGVPTESKELRERDLSKNKRDIVDYENFFGVNESNREILENIWQEIINHALEEVSVRSLDEFPELNSKAQLLLSGLLITADWIASNTELFPLISVDDNGNERCYPQRVESAWEKIEFPEMWKSHKDKYNDEIFCNSFGFLPRATQRAVLDIVSETKRSGIFILEAPMGIVKSEAALAAAELLAAKNGKNGLFFGLPTQATANGIFPRIISWAEKQSDEYYHSIQLKHGSASLNSVFQNIQRGIPEEETDSGLIVHSWFCDSKKACLADFVVATVDQMLMSALKRRHVMLLYLGLSEKVVVIDEVHAYDAYMNQYLERALQWLGAYHTPVILLSATLPSQRRMSLIRAYLQKNSSDSVFEKNDAYPLLTWTDGNEIKQQALPYDGHHREVIIQKCSNDVVLEVIKDAVQAGGCVGIIMNTVKRAQDISEIIRREITENTLLYHAQYIMPDRSRKETELLEKAGKKSNADTRSGFVVVGTQVLEQSLDIDFDLMITDICPMDLLLQRIGRLHRHERDHRPDELKEPVCYVITDEFENEKTGSKYIYGEWLLKETIEMLPETIMLPDDISPLVQKVYNASDESKEYEEYRNAKAKSENRAGAFLLDGPDNSIDDTIHGLLDRTVDSKDTEAEASVRDGISSIEVLLMQRCGDGVIKFIDGTALSSELTEAECEHIAEQVLRLPSKFCQKYNIEKTVYALEDKCKAYIKKWQDSHWLKGKLVLFLDENMEAELLGYKLRYSYENGLICDKESGECE